MASYTLTTTDDEDAALTWVVDNANAEAQAIYAQDCLTAAGLGLPSPVVPVPYTNESYLQMLLAAPLSDFRRQHNTTKVPSALRNMTLEQVIQAFVAVPATNQATALTALNLPTS